MTVTKQYPIPTPTSSGSIVEYVRYDGADSPNDLFYSITYNSDSTYTIKTRYGALATGTVLANIKAFLVGGDVAVGVTITEISLNEFTNTMEYVSLSESASLLPAYFGKTVEVNGTYTITGPDDFPAGWWCDIVNIGSGTVTVDAETTINGDGTLLETQHTGCRMESKGGDAWRAIGKLTS